MSDWNSAILTKKGLNLQAKVEAGETLLNVTKIQLGSGILDANEDSSNLIALKKSEKDIEISDKIPQDGGLCTISGVISNQDINIGFYVKEMGLFATDPDEGEILYMYTTDNKPDYLPAKSTNKVVNASYNIDIAISNSELITAKINQVGLVTVEIMQHNITEHDSSEVAHKSVFKSLFNITDMTLDSMKSIIQNWSKEVCLPLYGGELTGDITANNVYANNNVLVFNNVAEMKASNKVKAGYTLKTLGFYITDDGGGADYVVTDTDNIDEDEVDEASIIALQKGMYAKLIVKDYVNIKQFGAKGDGNTDDTQAIKKANNFAVTNVKALFIPCGTFGVTEPLTIKASNIFGVSILKSKIKYIGTEIIDTLFSWTERSHAYLRDFMLLGDDKCNVLLDTTWSENAPSIINSYTNLDLKGHIKKGWVAKNNNDCLFSNVVVEGTNDKIAIEAFASGGQLSFNNCSFYGQVFYNAQNVCFLNCVMRGLVPYGRVWNVTSIVNCYLYPNSNGHVFELTPNTENPEENYGVPYAFNFFGTHLENKSGSIIHFKGKSRFFTKKVLFHGCHIFRSSGEEQVNMFSVDEGEEEQSRSQYPKTIIEISGGTVENVNLNEIVGLAYSIDNISTDSASSSLEQLEYKRNLQVANILASRNTLYTTNPLLDVTENSITLNININNVFYVPVKIDNLSISLSEVEALPVKLTDKMCRKITIVLNAVISTTVTFADNVYIGSRNTHSVILQQGDRRILELYSFDEGVSWNGQ